MAVHGGIHPVGMVGHVSIPARVTGGDERRYGRYQTDTRP